MAVGDILQATIVQSLQGSQMVNVLHYRVDAIGTGTAEIALAQELGETLAPAMKSALSTEWAYVATIGQRLRPLPMTFPFIDTTDAGSGSVTGAALPAQNALNITKTTLFAGTRWRGRFCLTGLPVAAQVGGQWSASAITSVSGIVSALLLQLQPGAWVFRPVLFHRDDGTVTPIDDFVVQKTVRAQRRRQFGKGS